MDHEVLKELFHMQNKELALLATYVFGVATGVPFFRNARNEAAIDKLEGEANSELELTNKFQTLVNTLFAKLSQGARLCNNHEVMLLSLFDDVREIQCATTEPNMSQNSPVKQLKKQTSWHTPEQSEENSDQASVHNEETGGDEEAQSSVHEEASAADEAPTVPPGIG